MQRRRVFFLAAVVAVVATAVDDDDDCQGVCVWPVVPTDHAGLEGRGQPTDGALAVQPAFRSFALRSLSVRRNLTPPSTPPLDKRRRCP